MHMHHIKIELYFLVHKNIDTKEEYLFIFFN